MPDLYCGVFSCQEKDCPYHIEQIQQFDVRNDFRNLQGSEVCRKVNAHKPTKETVK